MNTRYRSAAWFVAGVVFSLLLGHSQGTYPSLLQASDAELPSTANSEPSVHYDETWEAVEFIGVSRQDVEGLSTWADNIQFKLATAITWPSIGGALPAGLTFANSIPLTIFTRPPGSPGSWPHDASASAIGPSNVPVTGYAGLATTAGTGTVPLGLPVVTRWTVTGHIHSEG